MVHDRSLEAVDRNGGDDGVMINDGVIEPGRFVRGERANFTRLFLGCAEAKFCKLLSAVNTRWKALAEIYTMHSFAPFSNLIFFR